MNNRLAIVSTNNNISSLSNISINPLKEYSSISYKEKDKWIDIKEGTRFRPIHLSELNQKLTSRSWNCGYLKYVNQATEELYLYLSDFEEPIPTAPLTPDNKSIKLSSSNKGSIPEVLTNIFKEEKYSKILEEMKDKEINLFTSSSSVVDIMNGLQTIDVLKYNSDSYTNILSLIPLKNNIVSDGISAKVDLGIQYTSMGIIKTYKTTFEAFNYVSEENSGEVIINVDDFIEEIGSDVQIEYVNNIVRVLPISNDVTECIISDCTVTYGKFGE